MYNNRVFGCVIVNKKSDDSSDEKDSKQSNSHRTDDTDSKEEKAGVISCLNKMIAKVSGWFGKKQ